jgi:hypothetical protein
MVCGMGVPGGSSTPVGAIFKGGINVSLNGLLIYQYSKYCSA